jgi:hypothetical protein
MPSIDAELGNEDVDMVHGGIFFIFPLVPWAPPLYWILAGTDVYPTAS